MDNEELLRILGRVPEKELELLIMVKEATLPDGGVDLIAIGEQKERLLMAEQEAREHCRATEDLYRRLWRPRSRYY